MTKQIEALKLALEALEQWNTPLYKRAAVITAIREALAEQPAQQQEPVKWRTEVRHGRLYFHIGVQSFAIDYHPEDEPEWSAGDAMAWMEKNLHDALSKLSPPQRKPLTDDEIASWFGAATEGGLIEFARAIEAAHGIKEQP